MVIGRRHPNCVALKRVKLTMRIISYKAIRLFIEQHPDSKTSLTFWYKTAKKAVWKNLAEVKQVFPHADPVGVHTVFNIKGNSYRLIAIINYKSQKVSVRGIYTHEEYDKGKWKT